jgi:hypothetical protein
MPEINQNNNSSLPSRDEHGRFIKSSTGISYSTSPTTKAESDTRISTYNITKQRIDPPLLFLRISNPVTYIKRWWKRLMGNEGMELRLRIKPLTAIAIALALGFFGFGVGRVSVPADSPIVKYIPQLALQPTVNPWRETAFTGILHSTNGKIYLFTTKSETLKLNVPPNIDLTKFIGKRILVYGSYNESLRLLAVADPSDIELLSTKPQQIPTIAPSPTPTQIPVATPTLEQFPEPIYLNPTM